MDYMGSYLDNIITNFIEIQQLISEIQERPNNVLIESVGQAYYRNIDSKKKLFCAELPEYVGRTTAVQFHLKVKDIVSDSPLPARYIRDVLQHIREFCYYHGFKYDGSDVYQPLQLDTKSAYENEPLYRVLNERITSEELTNQKAGLVCALQQTQIQMMNVGTEVVANDIITKIVSAFIELYKEQTPQSELDWNRLGGGIDTVYHEVHHNILRGL
jgi:hypothetical protein